MEKVDGGSFYVMPDGRIVSLSETAMDMIAEMGGTEEGKEEEGGMLKIQGANEPTELLSVSEAAFDFDAYVETIVTYNCRNCEFTSQSRLLVGDHVREVHLYIKAIQEAKVLVSDDVEPVGGDEEVDVNPEQSVNGMRIIVNDQLEDEVGGGVGDDGLSSSVQGSGLPFESSHFSIIIGKDMFGGDTTMAATDVVSVLAEKQVVSLDPPQSLKKPIVKAENGKKLESNEMEANHEKRQLACSFKNCAFLFKEQEQLDFHLSCHREEGGSGFSCPEVGCELRSEKWREMATHLWRRHGRDCDMLLCSLCTNYRTMYPKILEEHHQTHMNLKQFVCDVCQKGFNQMSQLKNHAVIHLDKSGIEPIPSWAKPKQCDICQKMFSDSKCLKKHVQAIHSKLKPYICQVCGHQSARKAMLQLHVRQHTGEKPFQCDVCEYRTGDHNSLRRHKRKHTGDKPYKCQHCDYASIQSSSFKSHLRSKHPDQVEVGSSLPSCPLLLVELEQQDDLSQIVVVKEEGQKNE